jgi:hypothetical protein
MKRRAEYPVEYSARRSCRPKKLATAKAALAHFIQRLLIAPLYQLLIFRDPKPVYLRQAGSGFRDGIWIFCRISG